MRVSVALAAGGVLGVLALAAVRFVVVPPPPVTHHHANWAVFVDGERLDLTAERFMEDVAACVTDPASIRPQDRIHMHEGNHDVVHVHHPAATWGHLLANLGMAVGPDYLYLVDGRRLEADSGRTLTFIRNGMPMYEIGNEVVRSRDRVLISYGTESAEEVLAEQFPRVADDAAEYNEKADPAACRGGHEPEGFGARLRRAFIG